MKTWREKGPAERGVHTDATWSTLPPTAVRRAAL